MRTLIVGAGTMGAWFGELIGEWASVAYTDLDSDRAHRTADSQNVEAVRLDNVTENDIITFAVPLHATVSAIEDFGHLASRAIIDLSGSMAEPLQAMRSLDTDCELLCLHPLFAPENAPGNVPMVTENSGPIEDRITELLQDHGNTPFQTTAAEHDAAMQVVQAQVHLVILAYADAAKPVSSKFHTPISRQLTALTRSVLDGDSRVYADIQAQFAGAEDIATSASYLASANTDQFKETYSRLASKWLEDSPD